MEHKDLQLTDIQGLITRGFGKFPDARYLLIEIGEPVAARSWLATIAGEITSSVREELSGHALNIAFTYNGFVEMGLDPSIADQFSPEFRQGMVTDHRQRLLGDHGTSAPEKWRFGGPKNPVIHIMLLLFASEKDGTLAPLLEEHQKRIADAGMKLHHELDAGTLKGRKEHFGFRDGISQPIIRGSQREGHPHNTVNAGEFILGYPNAYHEKSWSPEIKAPAQKQIDLPENDKGNPDFGFNGSYLVYRQLRQNVGAFWKYIDKQVHGDAAERIKLASKMVGRWPSGAPITKYPHQDPKQDPTAKNSASNDDNFGYYAKDRHGDHCPLGSHLRRNNPRDARENTSSPAKSLELVNRHRIIRRGRPYGAPLTESLDSEDVLKAGEEKNEMGLQFICFNTNLSRQFEFIQHTWINNPKFNGLSNDPDPITGDPAPEGRGKQADFTIQVKPVRKQVTGIPRFVDVRGGAYMFMPGIRALHYLSKL